MKRLLPVVVVLPLLLLGACAITPEQIEARTVTHKGWWNTCLQGIKVKKRFKGSLAFVVPRMEVERLQRAELWQNIPNKERLVLAYTDNVLQEAELTSDFISANNIFSRVTYSDSNDFSEKNRNAYDFILDLEPREFRRKKGKYISFNYKLYHREAAQSRLVKRPINQFFDIVDNTSTISEGITACKDLMSKTIGSLIKVTADLERIKSKGNTGTIRRIAIKKGASGNTSNKTPTKRSSLPPCPGSPTSDYYAMKTWTDCEGTSTYAKGNKYVGEWKDGTRHGKGTFTFDDGRMKRGIWESNKFLYAKKPSPTVTAKKTCTGTYKPTWNNCIGTRTFSDKSKYIGQWKSGKEHGQGSLTYADGEKYTGGFKDGLHHGKGTITYANGKTLKGIWENDKFKSARD